MYDRSSAIILEYHRSMMADNQRTQSFQRAIQSAIKPGDVVLDLGCGAGVLTCFACQAGAQRVHAIDSGAIIEMAKTICRANGFEKQVVFYNDLSTQVNLPEKVDLLITETIGNFGLEEGILGWVIDAKKRFLKHGAKIIPQSLQLYVAPVELIEDYQKIQFWSNDLHGLDFSTLRTTSANNLLTTKLSPESLLCAPKLLEQIDLAQVTSDQMRSKSTFTIERRGTLHGIGGWFRAFLDSDIAISNAPPTEAPSWTNVFLPLQKPLAVRPGDQLELEISTGSNASVWTWQINHQKTPGDITEPKVQKQSTFFGQLLSPQKLRVGAVNYRPTHNQDGEIAGFVLSLMDGNLANTEIAAQLATKFPDRFTNPDQAFQRVQILSRRYSR